jgi:hypothetical protein
MAQLPRLEEFEHQYLQEGVDRNDGIESHVANITLCFRQMHLRGRLPLAQQQS